MPSYYGHISNSYAWRLLFQKNACRVIPFVYMFLALTFSSMSRVTLTSPELFITVIKRKNKAKPKPKPKAFGSLPLIFKALHVTQN